MVRINSFIDRREGLQSVVGSVNIAARSIISAQIAVHTLGTDVQGTVTLSAGRAVGTLDINRLPRQLPGRGTVAGVLGSFASYLNIGPTLALTSISGTLPLATKTSGTLGQSRLPTDLTGRGTVAARIGSFGTAVARRLRSGYGSFGTVSTPLLRGVLFGSFGTLSGRISRTQQGSFVGTVNAPRMRSARGSFGQLTVGLGTAARSNPGDGTLIAPPARPRFVTWNVRFTPTTTQRAGAAIMQARAGNGGTLAKTEQGPLTGAPALDVPLAAWISPYGGSWNLRKIGSPARTTFLNGQEWQF